MKAIKLEVKKEFIEVADPSMPLVEVNRNFVPEMLTVGEAARELTVGEEQIRSYPRRVIQPFQGTEPVIYMVREDDNEIIENVFQIATDDIDRALKKQNRLGYENGFYDGKREGYNKGARDYKRYHNESSLWSRIKRAFTNYEVEQP